jgi:hypothetical protein
MATALVRCRSRLDRSGSVSTRCTIAVDVALDHLVIGASTLAQGRAWALATLGIDVPFGGQHASMATHNAVIALDGGAGNPDIYLEIIAVDPAAPTPRRPRWFGLDDPDLQRMLVQDGPQPLTWVVRTSDLAATVVQSPFALGTCTPMSRGHLHWQIAIPDDGGLVLGGLLPMLIEWPSGEHISRRMSVSGVTLERIRLVTDDPAPLSQALIALNADRLAIVEPDESRQIAVDLRRPDGRSVRLRRQP